MARADIVSIEGLAQLDRALRELPQRIANRGLRASVYAGAKVIRDEARSRAPKAAQSLGPKQPPPGTLKRSVMMKHIRELSGSGRQTFYVLVRQGRKYRNQGRRGNLSQDAWYWRFVVLEKCVQDPSFDQLSSSEDERRSTPSRNACFS